MAQIRDGCFRVIAINREDIDLFNLHNSRGKIVCVELHHDLYSSSLETQLSRLNPGNCIHAIIQSEDIYRPDGLWRVLEFDRFDETELHAIEVEEIIAQDMLLMGDAFEKGQSKPEVIEEDGRKIGFKIARPDSRGARAYGPVMTSYKECYKTLGKFDEPPYEIISITQREVPLEIRYYFAEKGTDTASRIIEAGEYLVGHDR